MLRDANTASANARAEMEAIRNELHLAREAEAATVVKAIAAKKAAGDKISELETTIQRTEQGRDQMRNRVESRLEALDSALAQELHEDGTQVGV